MGGIENDKSKSEKWNEVVDRSARGKGGAAIVKPEPTVTELGVHVPQGFEGLVGVGTTDAFMRDLVERDWEAAPMLYTIAEGTYVEGILEGNGVPAEFADKRTGEVKEVQTWILRHPKVNLRISILSSAQLDRKLPPYIGGPVKIFRGPAIKLKNNAGEVTDYAVSGPKRADGKPRDWSTRPALPAAGETHEDLTSGV
jgi:hypothetical protein